MSLKDDMKIVKGFIYTWAFPPISCSAMESRTISGISLKVMPCIEHVAIFSPSLHLFLQIGGEKNRGNGGTIPHFKSLSANEKEEEKT